MKVCSLCGIEKPLEEFNKNKTKEDGFQTICRHCSNEKSKRYYRSNRSAHIKACGITAKRIRQRNKERIFNYLSFHPCVECGEADPVVLDFDHVRDVKTGNISYLAASGCAWTKVLEEIEKCDIRCANCHRRVTAKRRTINKFEILTSEKLILGDASGSVANF